MTHDIEIATWNVLRPTLDYLDPNRRGWFVDAGAGQDTFYFEWLHNHGWKGVVIEPFPTDQVRNLCRDYGLHLEEAAVWTDNRPATIYLYPGNLNSLCPFWQGEPQEATIYRRTLSTILGHCKPLPPAISCLKLDIEGGEPYIIKALPGIREDWHPWTVVFEFGGQTLAGGMAGAWAESHRRRMMNAIRTLYKMEFKQLVIVRGRYLAESDVFTLTNRLVNETDVNMFHALFTQNDAWGNVIVLPECFEVSELIAWAAQEPQYSRG